MAHESASIAHPEPIDRIAAARRGAGSHANAATAATPAPDSVIGLLPQGYGPAWRFAPRAILASIHALPRDA